MLAQQSVGFIPVYLKINRCQHDISRNPPTRHIIPHMRIFIFKIYRSVIAPKSQTPAISFDQRQRNIKLSVDNNLNQIVVNV